MEKVEVLHVKDDILEVLPIIKLIPEGEECKKTFKRLRI